MDGDMGALSVCLDEGWMDGWVGIGWTDGLDGWMDSGTSSLTR